MNIFDTILFYYIITHMIIKHVVKSYEELNKLNLQENEFALVQDVDRIYKFKEKNWKIHEIKNNYVKQNIEYKKGYRITRNVNLKLEVSNDQIKKDFFDEACEKANNCFRNLVAMYNRKEFGTLEAFKKLLSNRSFPEIICKDHPELCRKLGFKKVDGREPEFQSIPKRGYVKWAGERISSVLERFDGKKNFFSMRTVKDSLRLHESQIKIKGKNVIIRPFAINQEFIYNTSLFRKNNKKSPNEEQVLSLLSEKTSFGGNLRLNKCPILSQQIIFEKKWLYQPVDFIGFDINKNYNSFLVFSQPIIFFGKNTSIIDKNEFVKIEKIKKIVMLEELLAELVAKKTVRKKIINTHKKLERLYSILVNEILNFVKSNKLCICIDNLFTGDRNGSFGQDKIRTKMIQICEKEGIPFVVVGTPYTTRICNDCGHANSKKELSIREFDCEKCKKHLVRDENAAKNVKTLGEKIWKNGLYQTAYDYYIKSGINILKYTKK